MLWMLLSFVMAMLIGILNFFTGDKAQEEGQAQTSGGWPFTGKGAKTVDSESVTPTPITTSGSKKID